MAHAIQHYRAKSAHLQLVMGVRGVTRTLELTHQAHPSTRRVLALWRNRATTLKRRYLAGPAHAFDLIRRGKENGPPDSHRRPLGAAPFRGPASMSRVREGLRLRGTAAACACTT